MAITTSPLAIGDAAPSPREEESAAAADDDAAEARYAAAMTEGEGEEDRLGAAEEESVAARVPGAASEAATSAETTARQLGQVLLPDSSHGLRHLRWNSCRQGSVTTNCAGSS